MSPPKSGRASKPAKPAKAPKPAKAAAKPAKPTRAATPRATTARGVLVARPKNDIYTALLGISLGAILLGCLLLTLVLNRYEFKLSPG